MQGKMGAMLQHEQLQLDDSRSRSLVADVQVRSLGVYSSVLASGLRTFSSHFACRLVQILDAEMWDGSQEPGEIGPHYKVHYKGWKQR